MGTGIQDQGHKTPDHHSGEAKDITSHSHQDTTVPDTRKLGSKPSLHIQWYHTKCQCELRTRNIQHGCHIQYIPGTIQSAAKPELPTKPAVPQ